MSGSPIPHSSIPPCQVLPFLIPLFPRVRFSHSSFLCSPVSGSPIPHSSVPPCQVLPFLIPLSPHVRFSHSSFLCSPMSGSPIPHSSVPPCQVLPFLIPLFPHVRFSHLLWSRRVVYTMLDLLHQLSLSLHTMVIPQSHDPHVIQSCDCHVTLTPGAGQTS